MITGSNKTHNGLEGTTVHRDNSLFPRDDSEEDPIARIDITVANVARIWNYWLGGKDNYAVDREIGEQIRKANPHVPELVRQSRAFLGRAVRYLAGEAGIGQFLDIGTGLPTVDNTHEVAQRIAPKSRIVYVDNDPLVLVHARALLTSRPEGVTDYIDADARNPKRILEAAARTLDFTKPVAVMLMGILEFITDDTDAYQIVETLKQALAPGSYLAMYDGTNVVHPEASNQIARIWNTAGSAPLVLRTPGHIAGFFSGLELVDPGIVSVSRWRTEANPFGEPNEVDAYGGVGKKP